MNTASLEQQFMPKTPHVSVTLQTHPPLRSRKGKGNGKRWRCVCVWLPVTARRECMKTLALDWLECGLRRYDLPGGFWAVPTDWNWSPLWVIWGQPQFCVFGKEFFQILGSDVITVTVTVTVTDRHCHRSDDMIWWGLYASHEYTRKL